MAFKVGRQLNTIEINEFFLENQLQLMYGGTSNNPKYLQNKSVAPVNKHLGLYGTFQLKIYSHQFCLCPDGPIIG